MFKKQYFLVLDKNTSYKNGIHTKNAFISCFIYRKKDKKGVKKFFLDYQISKSLLLSWFQAKYFMFLFSIFGRKNKNLFAYKFPNGTIYMRKCKIIDKLPAN